jgi:large subunit ribosomal protein L23
VLFNVTATDVNTLIMRGKDKRMGRGYSKLRNWKKAIVTLQQGDAIQFFDEKAE